MINTHKIFNLLFFIAMVVVNVLANILPFGHGKTGDISSKYPNLFTPAPITFAIWGVIYIMLAIFIVYQLGIFGNSEVSETVIEQIGFWFVISCILNIGWIFSWHYEIIWLSLVLMVGLLISLLIITARLTPTVVTHIAGVNRLSFGSKVSMYSFDIYLGWITAATIANASVLLVKNNWDRFGRSEEFWMVVVLLIGALCGLGYILVGQRYMAAVAIIWAYVGILIKHISQSGYGGAYPVLISVTVICLVAMIAAWVISLIMWNM